MENLKEEVDDIKNGISKTISDVSDILLDRFKNPYITAFSISWIVCNWKPIAFFIFSKGNVEYKINHISKHYTDSLYYFWWPLSLSLFFLFVVPYLNQVNEWFVGKAIKKRADYVKKQIVDKIIRDTEISQELDKKEKAIKQARESELHNDLVDSLNDTIKNLNETIHEERIQHNDSINKQILKNNEEREIEIKSLQNLYDSQIENLKTQIKEIDSSKNSIYEENVKLQSSLDECRKFSIEKDQQINYLKDSIENSTEHIFTLNNNINNLNDELQDLQIKYAEKHFNLILCQNPGDFIISIQNNDSDIRILKYYSHGTILYFNLITLTFLVLGEVLYLIDTKEIDIINDETQVKSAINEANHLL